MIRTIIFDFDGVISESVNIKTIAFAEMYKDYGDEVVKQVIAHHLSHGGVSRYEKFRIYHEEFLGIEVSEKGMYQSLNSCSFIKNPILEAAKWERIGLEGTDYFNKAFLIWWNREGEGSPQMALPRTGEGDLQPGRSAARRLHDDVLQLRGHVASLAREPSGED